MLNPFADPAGWLCLTESAPAASIGFVSHAEDTGPAGWLCLTGSTSFAVTPQGVTPVSSRLKHALAGTLQATPAASVGFVSHAAGTGPRIGFVHHNAVVETQDIASLRRPSQTHDLWTRQLQLALFGAMDRPVLSSRPPSWSRAKKTQDIASLRKKRQPMAPGPGRGFV